jgi:hypothetical protein
MLLPDRLLKEALTAIRHSLQGCQICDQDWIRILEEAKKCLQPGLSTMANTPLGQVKLYSHFYCDPVTIGSDLKGVAQNAYHMSLSTPGFWSIPPEMDQTNTVAFWGITRKGAWALIKILAKSELASAGGSGRVCPRNKAREIILARPASLVEIKATCQISFQDIWKTLNLAVKNWAERRTQIAEAATKFHNSLETVDQILSAAEE